MPVNKAYNLEKLVQACREYPLESRKRITFEYVSSEPDRLLEGKRADPSVRVSSKSA